MGLWVILVWDRCGEPSQALRASSPGGRAKGLVGADGRVERQGGVRWVFGWVVGGIGAVSPLRRFAPALPEGEPRVRWALMVGWRDKVGCGGSVGGWWVELVR